jgi:hypothetical protein
MTAVVDASAMTGTADERGHPSWCAVDLLPPGADPLCASDYTEVELSLGLPLVYEDGEISADKISLWLEQGTYEGQPRIGLAHGDVVGDDRNRLDAAELTIPEALELAQALMSAIAQAMASGHSPGASPAQ